MASDQRLEWASAIVLSVAALGASWATYQSGLWDGLQAANYTQANGLQTKSANAALEGDAAMAVEIGLFNSWLTAKAEQKPLVARFYERRFPPNMKAAFDQWLASRPLENPAAASSPFSMPDFRRPEAAEAAELDRRARQTFEAGQRANAVSDAFQQSATILALALFFGGIGQVFQGRGARLGLIAIAVVALLVGTLRMISLPMQLLGLGPLA